jgi:hypothetical protein
VSQNGIASSINDVADGVEVDVTTIDDLFRDHDEPISYLKADLEGYDVEMLEGAVETIRRHTPRIAITTYHRAEHARTMERLLRRVHPAYQVRCKGIFQDTGSPVMLHAWVD